MFHPVPCSGCRSEGFHGLRYKSDSANYHLCQMCFWRGNMDEKHRDDVFKEYNVWKVPGKPGSSLRQGEYISVPKNMLLIRKKVDKIRNLIKIAKFLIIKADFLLIFLC